MMFEASMYILGRMHGLTVDEIKQAKEQNWDVWSETPATLEGWAVVEEGLREFARHKWETTPPPETDPPVGEVPPLPL